MRIAYIQCLLAVAAVAVAFPLHADAPPAGDAFSTPLVVIHFNEPNVYFEDALHSAVSKALEVKKDAQFSVVLHPAQQSTISGVHLTEVMNTLRNMGLPEGQLASSVSVPSSSAADEVDIYVR